MTTHAALSPVTRETSAFVRDRGARAVMVTVTGGALVLRAKGLRARYVLDLGWCYSQAVKARVVELREERRANRQRGRGAPLRAVAGGLR
jgi:hypothetical protein